MCNAMYITYIPNTTAVHYYFTLLFKLYIKLLFQISSLFTWQNFHYPKLSNRMASTSYTSLESIQKKSRLFIYVFEITSSGTKSFTSLMADLRQDILTEFLHWAGLLMQHFLEGIALLRHCYNNPNEKSNKYKSSLLC